MLLRPVSRTRSFMSSYHQARRAYSQSSISNPNLFIGMMGYKPGKAAKSVTGHASVFAYDAQAKKMLFAKGWYPVDKNKDWGLVKDDSSLMDKDYTFAEMWPISDEQFRLASLELAQWERRSEIEQQWISLLGKDFDISGLSDEMEERERLRPSVPQTGFDESVSLTPEQAEAASKYDPDKEYNLLHRNCVHMMRDIVKATQKDVNFESGLHTPIDLSSIDALWIARPTPLIGSDKLLSNQGPIDIEALAQQSVQKHQGKSKGKSKETPSKTPSGIEL